MTIEEFLEKHQLPDSYRETIDNYFMPLAQTLVARWQQKPQQTLFVGINGCQGSGKTTLADYLYMKITSMGLSVCVMSIDDFYLTKHERQQLSQTTHPLLMTRGVPGTHDVGLAIQTLKALGENAEVTIPRFNKATDNRYPKTEWKTLVGPVDMVILEGWCVGTPAQELSELQQPMNELERQHDASGDWRAFVNRCLAEDYTALWECLDTLVMLKAPSFACVYRWRLEQEEKLRQKLSQDDGKTGGLMSAEQIQDFIAHYQRLTEQALKHLPAHCDTVFQLDEHRRIEGVK